MTDTRYARSGDVSIAYRVAGNGPLDLVLVTGFISHLDVVQENPYVARFSQRLESFARLIAFDKRGTGLSDPVEEVPTLEQRMDDVRAVMDAAGSERAALFGFSEGGPMSILFAATYPERTTALVLYGAMARSVQGDGYPYGPTLEGALESGAQLMAPNWGTGINIEVFAPTAAEEPGMREWFARFERAGASPAMLAKIVRMFLDVDVRAVLPSLGVPTLVIHRRGDRVVNIRAGRWLAEHIPGARFVELPGIDHSMWAGDSDAVLDEIQEFLTGARPQREPDRILATVLFTDIVGSTERAAEIGDARWRALLEQHDAIVRRVLAEHRGQEVKQTGDGFLATFDGPARAIRCARAIADGVRALGVEVRAGLHTGEIEILGDDVAGIGVNIGSRVADEAAPGEVLVSQTVKDLVVGSGIAFADRGVRALKGVPGEWRLYAVEG